MHVCVCVCVCVCVFMCVHVCVWLVWCGVCVCVCRGGSYCTDFSTTAQCGMHNLHADICQLDVWGYCTGYLTTAWCGMHNLNANVCQLDIALLELCGRCHFLTSMTAAVSEEWSLWKGGFSSTVW